MNISQVSVPFNTPVRMPNGLQWYEDELYVMDQLTDDVFVLDGDGSVKRVITTETVNGSGITVGGGFIWTACNSRNGTTARPQRPTDYHTSNVRKVDPVTGETIDFFQPQTVVEFMELSTMRVIYGSLRLIQKR